MINDPKKITKMGIAGSKHVEIHYTNKKEAAKLCEFFKSLQQS